MVRYKLFFLARFLDIVLNKMNIEFSHQQNTLGMVKRSIWNYNEYWQTSHLKSTLAKAGVSSLASPLSLTSLC